MGSTRSHDNLVNITKKIIPTWSKLKRSQFKVTPLTGGLTNVLTKIEVLGELGLTTPQVALIREFGKGTSVFFNRQTEEKLFEQIGESGFGPRLYGRFDGGRVEQYFEAKCLHHCDTTDVSKSHRIARKMGELHTLRIPCIEELDEEKPALDLFLDKWLAALSRSQITRESDKRALAGYTVEYLAKEIEFMKALAKASDSPLMLCHNDLQSGNILEDNNSSKIHFIDFEYSGLNYRGFDFANHFCEMSLNYNIQAFPGFEFRPDMFPKMEQMEMFFQEYLSALTERGVREQTLPSMAQLLKETRIFTLASHLMWGIWSIVQAGTSDIEFGYAHYACLRLSLYEACKRSHSSLL